MLAIPDVRGPIQTTEWAIEQVPPAHAHMPWPRCWQLLQKAVDRVPACILTSEGVLADVQADSAQLWIAWSYRRRRIEGAVVTRLFRYDDMPGKLLCEAVLWGGENMKEWGGGMFAVFTAWARSAGCDLLIWGGRRGWKRVFGGDQIKLDDEGMPVFAIDLKRVGVEYA